MESSDFTLLKDLGLIDTEIKIYTTLLAKGPNTYTGLEYETKIPRTTLVENIARLIEKDLVTESIEKSKKKFYAEDPSKIKLLINEKKFELETKLKEVSDLETKVPEFLKTFINPGNSDSNKLSIKVYRGKREVWKMYRETQLAETVYSFCDIDKYYAVFPDSKDSYTQAFDRNPVRRVYDILLDTPLAREIAKGHIHYHVKFLPKTSSFSGFIFGDYMLFNNKVALVQLNVKNPSAVVIESQDTYLGFVGLHKTMWELI